MRKGLAMTLLAIAAGLGIMVLALALALWALQDRLIYFPDTAEPPAPALLGLAGVEPVRLRTDDGLHLLAWWVPPARAEAPVVLFLHGNGGSLLHRVDRVRHVQAMGWGGLFVEWRGYGGNPGRPSEAGLLADARAGLARLAAEGVAPARIVAWGESLGTAVAVRLAAEAPLEIGAVMLEAPFTSLLDLARLHYPALPAGLLLRDRYESARRIPAVRAPIGILIGGRDRLVPPQMSRELAAAATAPLEVWEAPQADHNGIGQAGGMQAAAEFVARHLNRPPR